MLINKGNATDKINAKVKLTAGVHTIKVVAVDLPATIEKITIENQR